MKIQSITAHVFKIPLKTPFRISVGEITEKEGIIFEMRSGDVTGWGEAAVDAIPFYAHETVGSVIDVASRVLAPLLKSRTWDTPEELVPEFDKTRGNNFAKAGLEAAFWDVCGKTSGKSCINLIGGHENPVEAGPSIGIKKTPSLAVKATEEQLKLGMKRIKLKVCPGYDYEYIKAVREAFPDITLMVDANNAYSIKDFAHIAKWDKFNLLMIEQPLDEHDIYFHSLLRKKVSTPICLDESIHTVHDALCALEIGAADIINIKVCRVGGLCNTKAISELCATYAIPNWIGSRVGTGVAEGARRTAASLPNCTMPSDLSFARMYMSDDIVTDKYEAVDNCFFTAPKCPGMGFEVNREKLAKYTVKKVEM